jgi:hypothetical protein
MFLKNYQSEGRHYVVPTMAPPPTSSTPAMESLAIMAQNNENGQSAFSIFDLFRPSNLEDFGQQQGIGEEDSLGAAGILIYRPHHNIQYTDLVVQDGRGGIFRDFKAIINWLLLFYNRLWNKIVSYHHDFGLSLTNSNLVLNH